MLILLFDMEVVCSHWCKVVSATSLWQSNRKHVCTKHSCRHVSSRDFTLKFVLLMDISVSFRISHKQEIAEHDMHQ